MIGCGVINMWAVNEIKIGIATDQNKIIPTLGVLA